jgi:hypothetical protein
VWWRIAEYVSPDLGGVTVCRQALSPSLGGESCNITIPGAGGRPGAASGACSWSRARVGRPLRVVYGGVALRLPANVAGTGSRRVFELWIHLSFTGNIAYAYDPANLPAAPPGGVVVGAENLDGTSGTQLPGAPTGDLRVVLGTRPVGALPYSYDVQGVQPGPGTAQTTMTSSRFRGTAIDTDSITVLPAG